VFDASLHHVSPGDVAAWDMSETFDDGSPHDDGSDHDDGGTMAGSRK